MIIVICRHAIMTWGGAGRTEEVSGQRTTTIIVTAAAYSGRTLETSAVTCLICGSARS
jgi:hypothetical protein